MHDIKHKKYRPSQSVELETMGKVSEHYSTEPTEQWMNLHHTGVINCNVYQVPAVY